MQAGVTSDPDAAIAHAGSGQPLVLLHSGACTWREWRGVIERLAPTHEVLAPTMPGSYGGPPLKLRGRSLLQFFADYAEELLDQRGWTGPVAIAGSSQGAVTALELAARGRASTVIALAPPWTTRAALCTYGAIVFTGMLPMRLAPGLEQTVWRRTPPQVRSRFVGFLMEQAYEPLTMSEDDMLATIRSVRDFPFVEGGVDALHGPFLPDTDAITGPVTLVRGTRDRAVPPWMARRWAAAIPHADVVDLPGLRHVPHLRAPDVIAEMIAARTSMTSA